MPATPPRSPWTAPWITPWTAPAPSRADKDRTAPSRTPSGTPNTPWTPTAPSGPDKDRAAMAIAPVTMMDRTIDRTVNHDRTAPMVMPVMNPPALRARVDLSGIAQAAGFARCRLRRKYDQSRNDAEARQNPDRNLDHDRFSFQPPRKPPLKQNAANRVAVHFTRRSVSRGEVMRRQVERTPLFNRAPSGSVAAG